MGKYDAVGIQIGVDFESYQSVKNKLDKLLSKFANNASGIDIDINIKDVNKQLKEIEKTIKTLDSVSKTVANDMAKAFSKGVKTINKEAEKVQEKAQKKSSVNTPAFSTDDAVLAYWSKIEHQIEKINKLKIDDDLRKELGNLTKELYGLSSNSSKLDLQEFKNHLDDISNKAKNLDKTTKSVEKLKEQINSLPDSSKLPNGVWDDLNIVGLQEKADLLKGSSSADKIAEVTKEYNNVLKKIKEIQAETKKQETLVEDVTDEVALLKTKYENALKSIQVSSIGKYLNPDDVEKFRASLEKLDGNDLKEVTREARLLDQQLVSLRNNAQETANKSNLLGSIGSAIKTMSSYYISGQMISQVTQGIKSGVNSIIELDTALVDLKKVADETDATLNAFVGTANKMAIDLGHSTTAVISSVSDYIKVGYQFKEAQDMAKSTIIYSNVGDIDINSATESMVSTMKAFNVEARNSIDVVDKLNEVANKYAVSAGGLGEALKRSASSMAVANNSLDQTLALIAGANAVVQNEAKVGNALKTISMRLRGISEDSGELIPNLRETFMLLTNNKVDIMADEDTFKSTYDIMVELGTVWDSLTDKQRAYLAELSAGKTQANVFVSIMENMKDVQGAYETSLNSQGSAMREQERYMESLQAKINALKESVVAFWNALIESGVVGGVLDGLTSMVNLATQLVETLGSIPAILGTALGGLALFKPQGMAEFGTGLIKSFKGVSGVIGTIGKEMKKLSTDGVMSVGNIKTSMTTLSATTGVATTAVRTLGVALKSIGVGLAIGVAIEAIISLISYVSQAKQRIEEAVESAQTNIGNLKEDINTIEELGTAYEELSVSMGSLSGFQNATKEEQQRYLEVSERLLEVAPDLAVAFTDEGNAIVLAGQNLDGYIEKKKALLQIENEILALNSRKLLKDEVKEHQDKMQQIEEAKKKVEEYQHMVDTMKLNGLTHMANSDGYLVNLELAQHYLQNYQLEMKELQAEALKLDSTISEHSNNVLRANKAYSELTPTGQQAVQTLIDFDKSLLESDDTLNEVINSLGNYMKQFDSLDIGSGNFDVKAFEQAELQLHNYLKTLGFTQAQIIQISQALLNPYKQAWIQANQEVQNATVAVRDFDSEIATAGTELLDYSDKIQALKSALKELDENHGLSSQTLRSLVNDYPALISAIGDEEKQRRILMGAVKEQETLQEGVINNILELEKQAHIQKMSLDEEWYKNKEDVLRTYLTTAEKAYNLDLSMCKNLAEAKRQVDVAYAKSHKELMTQLYGASIGNRSLVDLSDTVNGDRIKELQGILDTGKMNMNGLEVSIDYKARGAIENEIASLQKADAETRKKIEANQKTYQTIMDGFDKISLEGLDLSGIKANISSGINSVNTPKSTTKKEKKEKEERIYTYDGNELDKYSNALEIILDQIDDYDKALDEAYAKKERLHDKQLYEEEIAYIDKITEMEQTRGTSYQNRIKDIEANNKAVLDAFKKQEGFTLNKWSQPELDKLFNEKYGAKKDFKTEAEKKAWETKAKAFQNYVDTYFKGVEAIEDLNIKLLENNEALVQLEVDKYDAQLEYDKKRIDSKERVVDAYSKELDILRELNQEDFSLQNYDTTALDKEYELLGTIAGKQHLITEEIKAQIEANMALLATLDATDARYVSITERIKELTDAQHDSYLKELQYRNEIKNKLIEQMSVELEKSLYGEGGQQEWEDGNNAKINALEEQLKLLKKQTDEKKKQEEAEKRALEIQKLRDKLENLKRQKTVQQLKQNADGSWEWEYVADQEAISKVEQEIKDKEKEQKEKEEEEAQKKEEEALQDKIDKLKDEAKVRAEAYQRMLNDLKKHMNSQENIFEMSGKDINKIVNSTLDSLDKVYNGKFSNIIESMREKAKELSGIFEDARDDAEDWYNDAIKPPSKGDDIPDTQEPPSSSHTDKTESEKEAWHANKDRIAKQMEKNSKAWNSASASEKKRLEQENEKLAKEIGAWKNSKGEWHIMIDGKSMLLYDSIGYRPKKYKSGGEVYDTGLQWLDGSKSRPERVLSAEQTQSFNRMVEIMPDFNEKMKLFSTIAPTLNNIVQGFVAGGTINSPNPTGATPISSTNGQQINIENIELPNVTDFDSFRKEMEQFLNGSFSGLSQSAKVQKSK